MRRDEKGIALIAVLILMGVLSVIASSLVFVSQTETWASQNYRVMTEARYGAESGVHRAANYLMLNYTPPSTTGADLLASYDLTKSPVEFNGQPVVLRSSGASNYPVQAVVDGFVANVPGTLAGGDPVTYNARAFLVAMRQVTVYGSTTPATIQTWRIVGEGAIGGARPASTDVEATVERMLTPMFKYAAFATDAGCGALSWSGGGSTDSYDSSSYTPGVFQNYGGNVGTNGNLDQNGGPTVINGSLSTPRSGVGSCATGAVTALTLSGSSPPTQGLIELPQNVTYPPPTVPVIPVGSPNVSFNSGTTTIAPGNYGDISFKGTLRLSAGTYNVNSLTMTGHAILDITSGPVILNVTGYNTAGVPSSGYMASPIDFTGQALTTNSGLDPTMFQIMYAGDGNIKMAGGADTAGLLYAPNATIQNNSAGAQWFGAVIGRRVTDAGHATIHYDRRLSTTAMMVGPWLMDSFSWRRF